MAELTKEEQIQAIYDLKVGYTLGHADVAMLKAMARQLLAVLKQEPVAYIGKNMLDDIVSGGRCCGRVWAGDEDRLSGESVTPLYAAPQLPHPAAVDEWRMMCGEWRDETVSIHDATGLIVSGISPEAAGIIIEAHNACRAAMLQGGNHTEQHLEMVDHSGDANEKGNSPVIPDGWVMVQVEPTEDMIVHGFESEPDESFSDEKEWEAYDAMSGCQQAAHRAKLCWAAMIAAAPKPDVR